MLTVLKEYADREGLQAEPGLKPKSVRWLVVFSPQGQFLGVLPADGADGKSGREFPACPDLTQQEMASIGAGCRHFLVDGVDVISLLTKDDAADAKLVAKHDFFVQLLERATDCLPELGPVAVALRDERTLAALRAKLAELKAKPTDLATPALHSDAGTSIPVALTTWHAWWQECRRSLVEARKKPAARRGKKSDAADQSDQMLCLLSGDLVTPQPTHNKIEGLSAVGGLSMGDALTSFDKDAFTSFGLEQGANAAMSAAMAKTYATALNHLIKNRSRRLAGTMVAYWYTGRVERDDDPIAALLDGIDATDAMAPPETPTPDAAASDLERRQAEGHARALLDSLRSGRPPEASRFKDLRYYALTLSANSGRVVIRDWMEGQFEALVAAVSDWFKDLSIVSLGGGRTSNPPRFETVVTSLLRERAPMQRYEDWVKPVGSVREALWNCAVKASRLPLPSSLIQRLVLRHREAMMTDEFSSCLDPNITGSGLRRSRLYCRMGLLKAFLVRSHVGDNEMLTYLNEDLDKPCYQFGRLVAVLAELQREALRKESRETVKSSIIDRFYPAASTTPRLVHARLVALSNYHLRKLEQGGEKGARAARAIRDRIAEISMRIDPKRLPGIMPLEEQSFFALGYYQQIARMNRDRRDAASRREESGEDEPSDLSDLE